MTAGPLTFPGLPHLTRGIPCAQALVRCEACAAGAERLGLPALLVVGPGFEGEEATPRMLAGERWECASVQGACTAGLQRVHACAVKPSLERACCPPCRLAHPPARPAECFEAVWGALYVDAGCSLAAVKEAYASLFPLPDPLAEAAKAEEREAADEAAVGGKVPATLL